MDYASIYKKYKIDYAKDLKLCDWCSRNKNLFVLQDTTLITILLH